MNEDAAGMFFYEGLLRQKGETAQAVHKLGIARGGLLDAMKALKSMSSTDPEVLKVLHLLQRAEAFSRMPGVLR